MNVMHLMPDSFFPSICGNAFVVDNFNQAAGLIGAESFVVMDNKREIPVYYKTHGVECFNALGSREQLTEAFFSIAEGKDVGAVFVHDGQYPKYDDFLEGSRDRLPGVKKYLVQHFVRDINEVKEDLKIFDGVIVFQKRHLQKYLDGGIPSNRAFYVPHPVPADFSNEGVQRTKNSVVYAGRVIPSKGVGDIFPYLEKYDLRYKIIGPDTDPESGYVNELRRKSLELGIENRVTFQIGNHDQSYLNKVFNRTEYFFIGSTSECYSLVTQEAMASGCRAIVRNNDDAFFWTRNEAFIYDGVDGLEHCIKSAMAKAHNHKMISDKILDGHRIDHLAEALKDLICAPALARSYMSSYMKIMG